MLGAAFDMRLDGALDGTARWQAAQLAIDAISARGGVRLPGGRATRLELVVYDAANDADSMARALERLAGEHAAVALLAAGGLRPAALVSALVPRLATPLIVLGPSSVTGQEVAQWSYFLDPSGVDALGELARFAASQSVQRIGWIAPRNTASDRARAALLMEAATANVRVIGEESYPVGGEPEADAFGRLAFGGAQAIVAWPRDLDDALALARLAAERARGTPLYLNPVAATAEFVSRGGEAALGVRALVPRLAVADHLWADDPLTAPTRAFRDAFERRFGSRPLLEAAAAWDAVHLVVAALEAAGPDRAALRDRLEASGTFAGASGPIEFRPPRHVGLDGRAFLIARAERGGWVLPA